jgi:mannan endo-1,4-beta-mannosidase
MGRTLPFMLSALLLLCVSFATGASGASATPASPGFVVAQAHSFQRDGKTYSFLGANLWYGMNLGSTGPGGDRARLIRELDRLQGLGVKNLRILAATEGPDTEPWRIVPSLQKSPGVYDADLLAGLDFLLDEMKKRDLTAVIMLGNFWNWSGGFGQYLAWSGAGPIPYPPPQPNGSWDRYSKYTVKFYSNPTAMAMYSDFVQMIVSRTNSISGVHYSEDPTIMAWELANEPRGVKNAKNFNKWIQQTSQLIKSLDSNHLVTTGCEGDDHTAGLDLVKNHSYPSIDYATVHIWAQNAGWYDPTNAAATYPTAVSNMHSILNQTASLANQIGKPIVLEEFGLARDQNSYDPASTVSYRDQYFQDAFAQVYSLATSPVAAVSFWAWGGEAIPPQPLGSWWKPGDVFVGDPPYEHQGWYSIFSTDSTTLGVISKYASLFNSQVNNQLNSARRP